MSGFPINLDLSEYFDDLRKHSSVFVNSSKCKDVGDVESHIKSLFALEDNICLLHKKFLIPKNEDVQILQQYDIFRVQKCNFYDLQIHKTKKVNSSSACDQKALNLTQSEKTIDLSCRPKQRLKANICSSPGTSGTLSLHVDNKTSTNSQIVSSARMITLNGNQNISREKQKHKKKKHFESDESDDDADTNGNILDMSVKNSRTKKHSNCFSTDDGSHLSESANDSSRKDITRDVHKKSKKRKKHSEEADDKSLDLASTCWESLVCDDISSKKKSKKAREDCLNGNPSTDTNKAIMKNELENQFDYSVDDDCSIRKKHKQNKKYDESKCPNESQENQYYSSSPISTSKYHSLKKSGISKKYCDNKYENSDSGRPLEEQKKRIKVEIDQMISELHKNNSETNSQTDEDDKELSAASIKHPSSENGIAENIKQESFSEFGSTHGQRKRKRKHNKKKKREKLLHMLAVGPALTQLVAQPTIAKSSTTSESPKHVFFTEDDFVEDMKIPPTPPTKYQTIQDSSQSHNSRDEVASSHEQSSSTPVKWQDQLLKLASTGSKPVVFHRNTNAATTNKLVLSSQPTLEHSKPALNSNQTDQNRSDIQLNPAAQDFKRCNGEVKTENNNEERSSCSGTVNSCSSRKGLPDLCKPLPIPNDLQNINLTDYPIIDKVVAEDLILFKVLKLSENSEPGVSKPILARVNGTSDFPDRISLQIMEGCEECDHCTQAEGEAGDEALTIELRWRDILEPRLFYP